MPLPVGEAAPPEPFPAPLHDRPEGTAASASTRPRRVLAGVLTGTLGAALAASSAYAHAPSVPSEPPGLLVGWTFDPPAVVALTLALVLYLLAVRAVDRAHPRNPVPRRRVACWVAGLAVAAFALTSPLDGYSTVLFTLHMVQHLLLTMIAAPLLALGAPITLLLRVVRPDVRRRVVLPVLHSWPVRLVTFPVVTWIMFTVVMWASHFTPLFDGALESPAVHAVEHALYMAASVLFWIPVVGTDPTPWRLPHAARLGYLMLSMPQTAFLGLAIQSAPRVLYPHYATLERTWGPTPLQDQQLAGGVMWAGAEIVLLLPIAVVVRAWFRSEEERGRRADARLDSASRRPASLD